MYKSDDVCAIIVTYNPDYNLLSKLLNALVLQVQHIVIIDNSASTPVETWCLQTAVWQSKLTVISLQQNFGLGFALNKGIAHARKLRSEFVILFDQDSIPTPDMVNTLQNVAQQKLAQGINVGAVAPIYKSQESNILSGFVRLGWFGYKRIEYQAHLTATTDFLISSGSLIPMSTLDHIGDMDDGLFIDHLDTEWCFRAKSKGFNLYGVCDATMTHQLGDKRTKFWFGRWRNISYHAPFRYYYIFRNSFLLQKREYMPLGWKIADFFRCLRLAIFFGLFSPQRVACLKMMYKGLKDGLNGQQGVIR